jgi:hypothetical protein
MSEQYVLEKWLWTEADFERMGWHDSRIHAVAFLSEPLELAFDIDYILQWVQPSEDQYYRFWVAPATLVFQNVYELKLELEPFEAVDIADIHRDDLRKPRNAEFIGRDAGWRWRIETHDGDITFRAAGYEQHFRRAPIFGRFQSLDLPMRGGFSFERGHDLQTRIA